MTETRNVNPYGILLVGLAATFLPVWAILAAVMNHTEGIFMYPLDDVFIHMELSRHLAFGGNWGINENGFASASSSPLYTVVLAILFRIFSPQTIIPFLVNCTAAVALLFVLQRWLDRQQVNSRGQLIILVLVVFFTPLPILIISGMEHTLQCLFTFLFLTRFSEWLCVKKVDADRAGASLPFPVMVYGSLVCATRYEGLFLVGSACLVLIYYKRFTSSFKLLLFAAFPLIAFGLYSLLQGSYFLPNSVLVKADSPGLSLAGLARFAGTVLIDKLTVAKTGVTLLATQRLLLLLPLALLLFFRRAQEKSPYFLMLVLLLLCTLMHLVFATTGWFYRYEAYLVFSSFVVLSLLVYQQRTALLRESPIGVKALALLLGFALLFPFVLRSTAGFSKAAQACINIFDQQYQMGQFLRRHYNSAPVAVNDLGAVSYYTSGEVLDLWGLGNNTVARSRKGGTWTPPFLDSLSRGAGVHVAIVYDKWFDPALLARWVKVATWQIQNNVICGDDTVSFYSLHPDAVSALRANLQQYQPSLPAGVAVRYYP